MLARISILSAFVCLVLADVTLILPGKESTDIINESGSPGLTKTWNLITEYGYVIKVICDRLQLVETKDCEGGFLEVKQGSNSKKYCGGSDGLSFISEKNDLTLTFSLIKSNGYVKCSATGVKKQAIEPSYNEDGDIYIPLNGPAYDKIFFQPVPSGNKKWAFTTNEGSKLSIKCTSLSFLKDPSCSTAHLTILHNPICTDKEISIISPENYLNVELLSTFIDENSKIDCIVQAISGPKADQFKNSESIDIDSSEHGITSGQKTTSCKCGWANNNERRLRRSVDTKTIGSYPWMASVMLKSTGPKSHLCSGVIISPRTVLTAGHCTKKVKPSDLDVTIHTPEGEQSFSVVFIRDDLHSPFYTNEKDISILFLENKITFTETVGPICLDPIVPSMKNQILTATGWGDFDLNTKTLKHTHVKVVDFNTCNFLYQRKFRPESSLTRFCTWAPNENDQGASPGDAGSPLAYLDPETNRYTLVGLVSMGGNPGVPDVNTFVPEFYAWLHKYIRQHAPEDETCRKQG